MGKRLGDAVIKNLAPIMACAAILSIFMVTRFWGLKVVYGTSMEPAIRGGSLILTTKEAPENPEKGQVVLAQASVKGEKPVTVVKRIAAVPGDTVQVMDGRLYVNGKEELFGKDPIEDPGIAKDPVVLGKEEYFLLGDNVNESADSRMFGPVKKEQIKAAFIRGIP